MYAFVEANPSSQFKDFNTKLRFGESMDRVGSRKDLLLHSITIYGQYGPFDGQILPGNHNCGLLLATFSIL